MESRVVVLVLFLATAVGVVSLAGYRKYYDPTRAERVAQEAQKAAEKAKAAAENPTAEGEVAAEATVAKVVNLDAPELKAGKEIFVTKGQCITCHGDHGQGNVSQLAPKLSQQHDWYLLAQLKKMKAGERVNEKMNPYLKDLTEKDLEEVVKYITALPAK